MWPFVEQASLSTLLYLALVEANPRAMIGERMRRNKKPRPHPNALQFDEGRREDVESNHLEKKYI
jgi:hypothetical protein